MLMCFDVEVTDVSFYQNNYFPSGGPIHSITNTNSQTIVVDVKERTLDQDYTVQDTGNLRLIVCPQADYSITGIPSTTHRYIYASNNVRNYNSIGIVHNCFKLRHRIMSGIN